MEYIVAPGPSNRLSNPAEHGHSDGSTDEIRASLPNVVACGFLCRLNHVVVQRVPHGFHRSFSLVNDNARVAVFERPKLVDATDAPPSSSFAPQVWG